MDYSIPLDDAGLSPGEQKVYLALLKSGSGKVTSLKKATQLHRTTIYDFLESLIKKGMVSYSLDGKTRVFKAAEPRRLLSLLDERREAVESALPSLNGLMSSGSKAIDIEVFQGKEGLKSVLSDIFVHTKKKNIWSWARSWNSRSTCRISWSISSPRLKSIRCMGRSS